MKKQLSAILTTAFLSVPVLPASAQEAEPLILRGEPYPQPKIEVCKQVLEQGHIIKTDANGALHIPFDGFYFVIEVDEKEMRCRMYRHIVNG